jgi:hypothetical protein
MEAKAPVVYQRILAADRASRERFGGHGSAIAQVYNHMILPLANRRDKETQVAWGLRDFERRFGRFPEGMWLAETACDVESLEVLAARGIRFTILAPHQAWRTRRIGEERWTDVGGARIDPTRPYLARLPSGREIVLFFYDGPISRAVAFERLLVSGDHFASRILGGFSPHRGGAQLVHIATDGETYGHHHRHGDMALAWALEVIERSGARLTNYGEYLELFPPDHEVEILEDTSWSCAHGVDRWRIGCGCASGGQPDWQQEWREPLRQALDGLRDAIVPHFEEHAAKVLRDPWGARDAYVRVLHDRSEVDAFLGEQASHPLSPEEQGRALALLELQRHAMLMYTSCGWFFDELSGIEAVQVMRYAARAMQLGEGLFGTALEPAFLEVLGRARSNLPEMGDGREVWDRKVRPSVVDLAKVGAHYAVSSLFEEYRAVERVFRYRVERLDARVEQAGRAKVTVGRARITSEITRSHGDVVYGVLHFGDHNLVAGVREYHGETAYVEMVREVSSAFARADLPQALRALDKHFIELTYSLRSLFRDEQRKILARILEDSVADATQVYEQLYEHHAPLMRFLAAMPHPLPRAWRSAAELVLDRKLRRALATEAPDPAEVGALLEQARELGVTLDAEGLGFELAKTMERQLAALEAAPLDLQLLSRLEQTASMARIVGFEVQLDRVQDGYHALRERVYPDQRARADAGDDHARAYAETFASLGTSLRIRVA